MSEDSVRMETRKKLVVMFKQLLEEKKQLDIKLKEPINPIKVNDAKWDGLLDFVEFDLYYLVCDSAVPDIMQYDFDDPEQKALYDKAVAESIKFKRDLELKFNMFSMGRRSGQFPPGGYWMSLIHLMVKELGSKVKEFEDFLDVTE